MAKLVSQTQKKRIENSVLNKSETTDEHSSLNLNLNTIHEYGESTSNNSIAIIDYKQEALKKWAHSPPKLKIQTSKSRQRLGSMLNRFDNDCNIVMDNILQSIDKSDENVRISQQ